MRRYSLEELRGLKPRKVDSLVAPLVGWTDIRKIYHHHGQSHAGRKSGCPVEEKIPRFTRDLNLITAAMREWCGEDRDKRLRFVDMLERALGFGDDGCTQDPFTFCTATARDLSMALVLAAQGEGEEHV